MSEDRMQLTVPSEREALVNFCNDGAAYWHKASLEHATNAGLSLTGSVKDATPDLRKYWRAEWLRRRWLLMVGVVIAAQHESTAHNAVSDFYMHSDETIDAMASEFVDERVVSLNPKPPIENASSGAGVHLAAGALGYWAANHGAANHRAVVEKDKLIAKLTEDTMKIGMSNPIQLVPGMATSVALGVLEPAELVRLAFGEDCKSKLHICHADLGYVRFLDKVSAEAFGDPGACIVFPERSGLVRSTIGTRGIIYPSVPLRITIENRSGETVTPVIWIGVRKITSTCQ